MWAVESFRFVDDTLLQSDGDKLRKGLVSFVSSEMRLLVLTIQKKGEINR